MIVPKTRYLKHKFNPPVFKRGDENDPLSPNGLNYFLTRSEKTSWDEGQILVNFITLLDGLIMYHSTVKVGKLIREGENWIGKKEQYSDFLSKISLDENGEPLDKGYLLFSGEYIDNPDWKHGDIVKWPVDRNGNGTRNIISKNTPIKLDTDRFETYEIPEDIVGAPYTELEKMLNSKKMIDLLVVPGVYMWTDSYSNKYIGSAYSENGGLVSRILDYIKTGHGNNKKMILENEKNLNFLYNCSFTVLNTFPPHYTKNQIIRVEANRKKEHICTWN